MGSQWLSRLARLAMAILLFEALTGLAVTFAPFHATVEWGLLAHTAIGAATLLPLAWYNVRHWRNYRAIAFSHIVLLGYIGVAGLAVCSASGVVVTSQGLFGVRTSTLWRTIHLASTFATLATALPHVVLVFLRTRRTEARPFAWSYARWSAAAVLAVGGVAVLPFG